jgi:hypothetical protein
MEVRMLSGAACGRFTSIGILLVNLLFQHPIAAFVAVQQENDLGELSAAYAKSRCCSRFDPALQPCHAYFASMQLQKRAAKAGLLTLLSLTQVLNCAVQHGDWRRRVAALLGRFLPKLRAAGNSGLFSCDLF